MRRISKGSPPPNRRKVNQMMSAMDDADVKIEDGEAKYVGVYGKIKARHVPMYTDSVQHTGQKFKTKGQSSDWTINREQQEREFFNWIGRALPVKPVKPKAQKVVDDFIADLF